MKIKSLVNFSIILFLITGILQLSTISTFAQQSGNLKGAELLIPSTNEIGPYEIGTGLVTASGIIVNQAFNIGCGFNSSSPYSACGVSVKGENYWLGLASNPGLLQHSFSNNVNNIEYNIINMNQGEVITVTVSNGTPTITATTGCDYNINGNIISGTKLSGDTGVKIKITSTQPYTWVRLSHGGGGWGCMVTLDGNSVVAPPPVPFSKWATIFGFSFIFLMTIIRFKRIS